MTALPENLRRLAEAYGVEAEYWSADGERKVADPNALVSVLRALGCGIETPDGADAALQARHREVWTTPVEPCVVSWGGEGVHLLIRHEAVRHEAPYTGVVVFEDGRRESVRGVLRELETVATSEVDGALYQQRRLVVNREFPTGYHRIELEIDGATCETHVLSAPWTCYGAEAGERMWGVFAPLYALRSRRSDRFGGSDLTDLTALMAWVGERDGRVVGTLPLLATFLEEPCHYSPYAPVSRLFWNELFIDISAVPELKRSPAARQLIDSPAFAAASKALAEGTLVDYRGLMAHRRQVLELLAEAAYASNWRGGAVDRFGESHPDVADYARFRAATEGRRATWRSWFDAERAGDLSGADVDETRYRYHLYVQYLIRSQLDDLSRTARDRGIGLYLDLPVGVHPDGYDAWRHQSLFVDGMTVGAPPDALFAGGQDWGVPAVHPDRSRRRGHSYLRDTIRNHCQFAGVLRIDHVMGLYRLYWVPQGLGAKEGIYVRYPENELYAIVSIESHRHQCAVVGEDLGTVPNEVREGMGRHGLHGMHVAQFAVSADPNNAVYAPAAGTVASVNTHDTPTFAGFWQSRDTDDRLSLDLIDEAAALEERAGRERVRQALVHYLRERGSAGQGEDDQAVLEGILAELASSPVWLTLVTLEDLWLESLPQNVPGTTEERDNWRHKMRHSLDELVTMDRVVRVLDEVARRRAASS